MIIFFIAGVGAAIFLSANKPKTHFQNKGNETLKASDNFTSGNASLT
jgi:hypothetical protein